MRNHNGELARRTLLEALEEHPPATLRQVADLLGYKSQKSAEQSLIVIPDSERR
jgi:hypothetical protein